MARLHFTCDEDLHDKATDLCKNAGLDLYYTNISSDYFISTYKKRSVDSRNFVAFDSGDWIACVGTIASDGQLGHHALVDLYDAVTEVGVKDGRKNVVGHYGVILSHDDTISIFTDPQGAISLYYSVNKPIFISNSLHLMGGSLIPKVNQMGLLEKAIELGETGEQTMFKGVHRLFGDEILYVDMESGHYNKCKLNLQMSALSDGFSNIHQAVSRYKSRVQSVFEQLPNGGSIGLFTTGGLDTRTVLAALLNQGIQPVLTYGIGNSGLTNTKVDDLRIAHLICEKFDLPFQKMDWSGNQPYSEGTLRSQFHRYGFSYRAYGGSHGFFDTMDSKHDDIPQLLLGGYSPAFTNMKLWEMQARNYSMDELINHYMHRFTESNQFAYSQQYHSYIHDGVQTALNHAPMNLSQIMPYHSFVQGRLFLYIRPEANFLNIMNQFTYYIAPFLTKQLYDPLLTMPLAYRKQDEFQLRLTHTLETTALDVPIFSGVKPTIIDKDKFIMKRPVKTQLADSTLELGKKSIPKFLYPFMRQLHSILTKDVGDDIHINKQVRSRDEEYLLDHDYFKGVFLGFDMLDLRRLNSLFRLVFAAEEIINTLYNQKD